MKIGRTLFWFRDGSERIQHLSGQFFGLGTLLNRLLNEKYNGKKIPFINLEFNTEKTYELFPVIPKNTPYYSGGDLQYYGLFDQDEFMKLSWSGQSVFLWERGCQYLKDSAQLMKNKDLTEAVDYAYHKGLAMELNPDFRVVDTEIVLSGQKIRASVWIVFKEEGMYSKLTLEQDGTVIFEKNIDQTAHGIEFFLEIYKSINLEGENMVIKGRKDVEYLPLKISLAELRI
ncbi:hypothetical protein [Chryseobacterium vaccae]|uniref:hypothetical protein n=1 Tax=Chryseobacterium vaccae TaxID=2604424 RepID=UPI001294E321|nr:hypothetical protein [Chryseobacterium vaccae]